MISCIGRLGDTWDLMQDYRCFPFGFGLLIWDRNPEVYIGTCRVCIKNHWPPQHRTSLHMIFMDAQGLLVIHFWDDDDMFGTLCPVGPHRSPTLLTGVPGLVRCHENIHSTTWTLAEGLWFIWRPMGSSMCPHTHWEHHRSTIWRTRGHPLVHHIQRKLFLNMAL